MDFAPSRRHIILGMALNMALPPSLGARSPSSIMRVLKTSGCGCCREWIKRMQAAGFVVEGRDVSAVELTKFKLSVGVKAELASCHTAQIGGYVVEGHVPAREIQRLLREAPEAIGLALPGMPLGSPGMEIGSFVDAYDVLLVAVDGTTSVFAHYRGK